MYTTHAIRFSCTFAIIFSTKKCHCNGFKILSYSLLCVSKDWQQNLLNINMLCHAFLILYVTAQQISI